MNGMVRAYERKLRQGAEQLEALERSGATGRRYEVLLRSWLELLAAYEYECDMMQSAEGMLAAI